MRRVLREVRIGLVAGVTGSAMLLLAQQVSQRLSARPPARVQSQSQWIPPLVDPIAAAQSALERGDSALVAVQDADSLLFPAVSSRHRNSESNAPFRLYSPGSTGLSGEAWVSFASRAVPYAAAYNAVVLVARARDSRTS